MTKNQQTILDNLAVNHCIISDAIDEVCSRQEFDKFMDDGTFRAAVKDLEKKRDDFVRVAQMDLIASGDSKLTLEYIKDLNKTSGDDVLGTIQRETMLYIIQTAKNNSDTIESFQKIFSCTKYKATKVFNDVLAQNDLESPTARSKRYEDDLDKSLYKRFERGDLTKIEMYQELVKDALHMSQFAGREDVRMNAGKLVISYDEHLVKEEERLRREAESDDANIFDKLDAVLAGSTPNDIEGFRNRLMYPQIEEA